MQGMRADPRCSAIYRDLSFPVQYSVCRAVDTGLFSRAVPFGKWNEMCKVYDVSVATFYRLLHGFKRDWRRMLKLVQKYTGEVGKEIDREIMKFVEYSYVDMDDILRKFYDRYYYGFLCSDEVNST